VIKDMVKAIRQAYSGQAARDDVAAIIRHHRIQASQGYRDAAEYVWHELRKSGLEAHIETFPANHQTVFWTAPSFQEWEATSATLHLIEPADQARKLADYRELKISLIQRSISFDGEAEVVLLEDGLEEVEYEGLDLTGKIVFTRGEVDRVRQLAVEKHGAVGIIFDGMRGVPPVREAMDLPDGRQYTSFWWTGQPSEKWCFGFVLSPRQGEWLRGMIRRQVKEGQPPVKVRVHVNSRLYDGAMEVVTALIPGETDEEVVVVAHLCHPQPSANDNASGAAAALESARTLAQLITDGDLPQPRRGIRFLWLPEITGSYAYLSRHEDDIPRMIAGVNLDMVGEDQHRAGASFLIECPPDAMSSFASDLMARLREELFDDAPAHTGLGGYALFRHGTTSFSGGSDHYIFSDPTVGVPMPMLIQWPDRFYHTSSDTLDKVDPAMLARAGTLAAAYAFFVANAGRLEATWLAHEMQTRFQVRLARLTQIQITQMWDNGDPADSKGALEGLERRIAYAADRHKEALATLSRLWKGIGPLIETFIQEAVHLAELECTRGLRAAGDHIRILGADGLSDPPEEPDEWEQRAALMTPRRLYRGPVALRSAMRRLSLEDRAAFRKLAQSRKNGGRTLPTLAEYWANGHRSALEIVTLVEMESGIRDAEFVVKCFELLQRIGLVDL
jgi:aminopeptidase-like protein